MTPREIAEARQTLGLTLEALASLLGYKGVFARQTMHNIEIGARNLPRAQEMLLRAYLAGYRPKDWPKESVL